MYYDVAVWEVKPVSFSQHVRPVCLPEQPIDPDYEEEGDDESAGKAVNAIGRYYAYGKKRRNWKQTLIIMICVGWGVLRKNISGSDNVMRHAYLKTYSQRYLFSSNP